MQLTINYLGGVTRLINLPAEFFTNTAAMENGKFVPKSPQQKAIDLAKSLDHKPVSMTLTRGTEVLIDHKIFVENRMPNARPEPATTATERMAKRLFRAKHKHDKFTMVTKVY